MRPRQLTALTLQLELFSLRFHQKMENGTQLRSSPNPYPQLNETMRSMIRRCLPSFSLSKSGSTLLKVQNTSLRSGQIIRTWSIS